MKDSIFPDFPYSQFGTRDQKLNGIARKYGGWLTILDPDQTIADGFLEELARAGYRPDEVSAMRALIDTSERNQLLMRAANIKSKMRLVASDYMLEHQWSEILPRLIHNGISEKEIDHAAYHLIPIILEWMAG